MDRKRRGIVQQGIGLIGATTGIPGMRQQGLLVGASGVLYPSVPGDKEIKYLEQKITFYWQARQNVTLAPADLILHMDKYVREVTTLLDRSLLPSIRTRLCACLSQGMLLMGVSLYSMGQFQTARTYYQIALKAAYEAEHNILQALAWYHTSFSWMRSNEPNRYKHALNSMSKACHFASLESDLAIQGVTLAGSAEAHAYLNEREACLQALKRADKLDGYGSSTWRYTYGGFGLSVVNGYRGICLQQFYQQDDPNTHPLLEEAKQALEEALSQPHSSIMQRAFYVIDMAQIHARKGDVESACDQTRQVISIADTNFALRQRLLVVCALLEPYTDVEAVKDLDTD